MKAQRLAARCPICNRPIARSTREHLYDHSKEDLVNELLGYMEDEDGDEY